MSAFEQIAMVGAVAFVAGMSWRAGDLFYRWLAVKLKSVSR